jgi:hypothetical protein
MCVVSIDDAQQGGIAQLGERLHGMQEVSSSILLTSTNFVSRREKMFFGFVKKPKSIGSKVKTPSSRGLGHYPFTVSTGVRIPVGSPAFCGGAFFKCTKVNKAQVAKHLARKSER